MCWFYQNLQRLHGGSGSRLKHACQWWRFSCGFESNFTVILLLWSVLLTVSTQIYLNSVSVWVCVFHVGNFAHKLPLFAGESARLALSWSEASKRKVLQNWILRTFPWIACEHFEWAGKSRKFCFEQGNCSHSSPIYSWTMWSFRSR